MSVDSLPGLGDPAFGRLDTLLVVRWIAVLAMTSMVGTGRASPSCELLADAETVAASPETVWGDRVWGAIDEAIGRLDPMPGPRLAWVELGAVSGAWYCRGADAIFASRALLEYAWLGRASDGADMLAFVLAHELAHRRFDTAMTKGPFLDASTCTGAGLARELEADERAAFLVALADDARHAGRRFSPWRLERQSTLAHYLMDVGAGHCAEARAQRLSAALLRMEGFGDAFELALALAFAPVDVAPMGRMPPRTRALDLLERLDAALNPTSGWARVPELGALIAWLHAQRVASLEGRGCEAPFPRHPAATPFDALGARAPNPADVAAAIAAGRAALARARTRRLPRALLEPIERCLATPHALGQAQAPPPGPRRQPAVQAPTPGTQPSLEGALEALALAVEAGCEGGSLRTTELEGLGRLEMNEAPAKTCLTLQGEDPLRVTVLRPDDGLIASLEAWRAQCAVFGQGVGDDGSAVHGARCPTIDRAADEAWTLFARGSDVERIIRVDHGGP